ncbi:MAG TPA: alpha/beta hydrolase-fold protein [Planctomycetota bacterium]|nr:alpha/beta hydrolase-fold protein [Planctomycetota bacterium]
MTVEILEFQSRVLRTNPLGDPAVRRIPVYLPPSYPRGRYPVFYVLSGFTGFGEMMLARGPWTESLPERLDRLIASRAMREALVVMPDCFTRYGGSQYLNSSATGRYEDHVVRELVPYIDRTFHTNGRRAVLGKSSGGYGALVLGMRHPEVFHALACHSGDMYFEYCYLPDFPKALDTLGRFGGPRKFLRAWEKMPKRSRGDLHPALNTLAMAACYSPKGSSFELPFDLGTGEILGRVWKRWKAWDPIQMLDRHARDLQRLRLVYLDCGRRDQFALHHGARIFAEKARRLGVRVRHEEFDDDHSGISYRYDRSLGLLSRALG